MPESGRENEAGIRNRKPNSRLYFWLGGGLISKGSGGLIIIQAAVVWQWFNFLKGQVPGGKAVLRLNVDETSVCLFQGGGKGTVIAGKRKIRDRAPDGASASVEPVQKVTRTTRRTCMTHVAFVCDRPDIQPLLPQVVIGNERTFPALLLAW